MEDDSNTLTLHIACQHLGLFSGSFVPDSFSLQYVVDVKFPVAYQDRPRCFHSSITLIESQLEPVAFVDFRFHPDLRLHFTTFMRPLGYPESNTTISWNHPV